jgi:2-keto-4-pentenoate hydratase
VNGDVVATGSGANVLADPRAALHWLANELPRLGRRLRAGELVTTGTTTVPAAIGPGDQVTADFGELGSVRLAFAR